MNMIKILIVVTLAMGVISINNAWQSYNQAQFALNATKQNVTNDVQRRYEDFRSFVVGLYERMESCNYSECMGMRYSYEWKSEMLKQYYSLAGCAEHSDRLSAIDRYMEARFYIAERLPVEKKKQLTKIQKNYYSVITEEINELHSKSCVMI